MIMPKTEEDKNTYFCVQDWMVDKLGLRGNTLLVYALIHNFSYDGKSYFYGSLNYIMERVSISRSSLITILQKLVSDNLIIKQLPKGGHKSFFYCSNWSRGKQSITVQKSDSPSIETALVQESDSDSPESGLCSIDNTGNNKDCDNICDNTVDLYSHEAQESRCAQEQSLARDRQTQTKSNSLITSCKPMCHVVAFSAQRREVAKEVFDIWQKANLPLPQEGFERFWEKDFKLATDKLIPQQLTTRTIVETCKNYVQVLSMGTQSWYTIRHSFDSFATEKTIRLFMSGYFNKKSFIRYRQMVSAVRLASSDRVNTGYAANYVKQFYASDPFKL